LPSSVAAECLNHDSKDFVFNQDNPAVLKIPVQTIAVILKILIQTKNKDVKGQKKE